MLFHNINFHELFQNHLVVNFPWNFSNPLSYRYAEGGISHSCHHADLGLLHREAFPWTLQKVEQYPCHLRTKYQQHTVTLNGKQKGFQTLSLALWCNTALNLGKL